MTDSRTTEVGNFSLTVSAVSTSCSHSAEGLKTDDKIFLSSVKADVSGTNPVGTGAVQVLNLFPLHRNKKTAVTKIRVACVPCQISKQRCDEQRPCTRCTVKGNSYLCVDRAKETVLSSSSGEKMPVTKDPASEGGDALSVEQVKEVLSKGKKSYNRKSRKKAGEDASLFKKRKLGSGEDNDSETPTICLEDMMNEMFQPVINSMYDQVSPFALREFLEKELWLYRFHLTASMEILDEDALQLVRNGILQSVSLAVIGDEESKKQLENTLSNIDSFPFLPIENFRSNQIPLTEAERSLVEEVFNVKSIDRSDLAIFRREFDLVSDDSGVRKMMNRRFWNENLEILIGKNLDPSSELKAYDFLKICCPSALQVMAAFHVSLIAVEGLSSFTDTFDYVLPEGTIIRCYTLLLRTFYRQEECVKTTVVLKPCSIFFDPDKNIPSYIANEEFSTPKESTPTNSEF